MPPMDAWKHGSSVGYAYHKCRCDECRAYHRDYMRRRRGSALAGVDRPVPKVVYSKAVGRLVQLHRDELARLIADELGEAG